MKKNILIVSLLFFSIMLQAQSRIIIIGAHPDDCEIIAGGSTIKLLEQGHAVKFVSLTNGNKGHHILTSKQIEEVRGKEVQQVRDQFNLAYEVLDYNDGELVANLESRDQVIKLIREWKADIVITHPPYDYHPDHRNTSTIVQDAAFLVTVPLAVPSTPYLRDNPLFLYMLGRLHNPYKENTEIVVDIAPVLERKVQMLSAHNSQFFEWLPWIDKIKEEVPQDKAGKTTYLTNYITKRNQVIKQDKEAIKKWYGKKYIRTISTVERFEYCPFGRKVTDEELKTLFPVFGANQP